MANLTKARLAVANKEFTAEESGTGFDVQLNPTSLHYVRSTALSAKPQEGSQPRQFVAGGPATLSLDLHFDTADDGSDVIEKWVRRVEQFLLPRSDGQEPPRIFFTWGTMKLAGVLRTLDVAVDLFSDTGIPLRAKVGISIEEQLPKVAFSRAGPGARTASGVEPGKAGPGAAGSLSVSGSLGASLGLAAGGGVGLGLSASAGFSAGGQTAAALGGESAAAFAARVGVDPAAWRAIAAGQVDAPASLPAGQELDFSSGLSAGAGVGVSAGAEAGAAMGIEEAFGLTSPRRGPPEATQAAPGFSLAAGGGVAAALATVEIVKSEGKAAATRQAFGAPDPARRAVPTRPQAPDQARPALARTPASGIASPAPLPPSPDRRASSFGLGVPLRPRVGPDGRERAGNDGPDGIPLRARRDAAGPSPSDPTAPPWTVMPETGGARRPDPARSSGCGPDCGCHRCGGARCR